MTRPPPIVLIVIAAIAIFWLATLQTDITAGNDSLTHPSGLVDPLMDDSGEFVVAWHTWGVTHPPGYPLLNFAGNVLARVFGTIGATPAAAASLVSWVFALAALGVVAGLVGRGGGARHRGHQRDQPLPTGQSHQEDLVVTDDFSPADARRVNPRATSGESLHTTQATEIRSSFDLTSPPFGLPLSVARGFTLRASAGTRTGLAGAGPAAAVLLPAFGELVWLYASVAEVYALGLLLALICLWLALRVGDAPEWRRGVLALGLVAGLAVGHHRTLLALVPAIALAAWPALRPTSTPDSTPVRRWRWWLAAGGLALASLAVYLYLPLAALAGSPWVYGRSPATWDGFLDAILAREYAAQLAPPTAPAEIAAALAGRAAFLAREMTPLGLALGVIGLAIALRAPATRRTAGVMALAAAGYFAAPVSQYLVVGTHMLIMVASAALAVAWGLGVAALAARRPGAAWIGLALSAVAAMGAVRAHHADIATYTRDRAGRHLVDAVAGLDDPAPTVVESWSPRYFALAYGRWATGEIATTRLVDVRPDMGGLDDLDPPPDVLYTTPHMFYVAPLDRWSDRLGVDVALESAGDGLIAVRREARVGAVIAAPVPTPDPSPKTAGGGEKAVGGPPSDPASGPDITIDDARAWLTADGDIRVTVEWHAVRPPAEDYRVFVHAVDGTRQSPATGTILAQADRDHPVYGFYPTSRWRAGERVRDDYRITGLGGDSAGGRRAGRVDVGLYRIRKDGSFENVAARSVPVAGES